MRRTVLVVWWIGLIGAIVAGAALVKEVALVLKALREIRQLAYFTRDAARQLASNLSPTSRLSNLQEPADRLRGSAAAVSAAARSVEHKVGTEAATRTGQGG